MEKSQEHRDAHLFENLTEQLFEESRKNRHQKYIRTGIMLLIFAFVFISSRPSQNQNNPEKQTLGTILDFVQPEGTIERTPFKALAGAGAASKKEAAHIAIIPLTGTIAGTSGRTGNAVTEKYVRDILNHTAKDSAVKAIVLEIDSPGGALIPTDNIYQMLKTYKSAHNQPIFAYVSGMAASGGYYLALAADEIIAHPLAFVGNVGAIMERVDYSDLSSRIGVKMNTFKSGELKDMGNPFSPVSKTEAEIFAQLIAEGFNTFVQRIEESRGTKLDQNQRALIFDGRIFTAKTGRELGLIDRTAYLDDALAHIVDQLGRDSHGAFYFYQYKTTKSVWWQLFSQAHSLIENLMISAPSTPVVSLR